MAAQLTLLAFQGAGKELLSVALEPPPDVTVPPMPVLDDEEARDLTCLDLRIITDRIEANGWGRNWSSGESPAGLLREIAQALDNEGV